MKKIIPKFKSSAQRFSKLRPPTIQSILTTYPSKLRDVFGPKELDVESILMHALKKDKAFILTHQEKRLTSAQFAKLKVMMKLREKEWPLQYIFGKVEFKGVELRVNQFVLIPRPETEQLVDIVAEYIKNNPIRNIVDIGTGSGAVIIALYKILNPTRIDYNYIATDKSAKSIQLARLNGIKNRVKVNFRIRDYLHKPNTFIPLTSWVLISNPPYVETKDLIEPSIAHEPKLALDGGKDGLEAFRSILEQVGKLQNKPKAIFFEIGYDQAKDVKLIAKNNFPVKDYKVYKDFAGKDRVVRILL